MFTPLQIRRDLGRHLTQLYLKRIAAYDKSGPILNAVQTLNPEALREADALDAAWKEASGQSVRCIASLF
jgi:amidase